jgi:hypothetical protein
MALDHRRMASAKTLNRTSQETAGLAHSTLAPSSAALDAFLTRWRDADGPERANHQLFLSQPCAGSAPDVDIKTLRRFIINAL